MTTLLETSIRRIEEESLGYTTSAAVPDKKLTIADLMAALERMPNDFPRMEIRYGEQAIYKLLDLMNNVNRDNKIDPSMTNFKFGGIPVIPDERMPENMAVLFENDVPRLLFNFEKGTVYEFPQYQFPFSYWGDKPPFNRV